MTDFLYGIFGIIGGLLCIFADILFDLKGKNNVKSGPAKIIDSNWQIMSEWRFNIHNQKTSKCAAYFCYI